MGAILISVNPEYCIDILSGYKISELRKTKPKCKLPVKVYVYCTKGRPYLIDCKKYPHLQYNYDLIDSDLVKQDKDVVNGKVIAEFILNKIDTIEICDPVILINGKNDYNQEQKLIQDTQLSFDKIIEYIGYGDDHDGWSKDWDRGYAWHINDLKTYDKPKELSEFSHYIPNNKCPKREGGFDCVNCSSYDIEHETCLELYYLHRQVKRPPQSWCYVEELKGD